VAKKARARRQQPAKIGMRATRAMKAIRMARATRVKRQIRNENIYFFVVKMVTNDACMQSPNIYSQ
jgi:F0F1-type ATP synthase gamma subunit